MLVTAVVLIILVVVALLLWSRRRGNVGERDVDVHGAHSVGEDGAPRQNGPRGGNASGR
jgi:hypothetical protein